MQIFGEVDRTKEGKVKSEYPSWYHKRHIEDLEEGIRHKEFQLENDLIASTEKQITRDRLKQEKAKLESIEASKPNFTDAEKDEIAKVIKSLSGKIKDMMPSRSEIERNLVDAHEEARKQSLPCVQLDSKEISFVKACDVTIANDGKVTLIGATKAWKIGRRILDENSNTEVLRKG